MRIKTVHRIIYALFLLGAMVVLIPCVFMPHSDYLTVFMYIGGSIGICGMIFALMCLRCPSCRTCDSVVFRGYFANGCPRCGGELT